MTLAIIAGALLGSFIATLVLRWPEGDGVVSGRSRCDHCGKALGPLQLIPIISHLVQRGRCKHCDAAIDPFHLRVELAAALIGGASLALLPNENGLILALMGWLLLPLFLLDARHLWLPDRLTILLAVAGLGLAGFANEVPVVDRLIGGVAGFAALWLIAAGFKALRGRDGMGSGDPKLFGAIGCWIGWQALPFALLAGSAGLLALVILQGLGRDREAQHPLGAGLAVGAFLTFAWQLA